MSSRCLQLARITVAVAAAGALALPGIAQADPEHRSDRANQNQQSKGTPPGQEKKATPAPNPGQHNGNPSAPGQSTAPGQAKQTTAGNGSANGDPAGNNGTIKVDFPAPADSGHANRPHPGCAFQLRMFNFDDDQYGALTITGQAPTRTGTLLSRRILLSNDPAGGGQDVDEVYSFTTSDLGLAAVPQAKQGWHLKVAVNAENAPGGAKQKVFWLSCPSPAAAPAGVVRRPAALVAPAVVAQEQPMGSAEITLTPQSRSNAEPLSFTGGGGLLRGAALPFTGIQLSALLLIGGAAITLGAMAVAAGWRRSVNQVG